MCEQRARIAAPAPGKETATTFAVSGVHGLIVQNFVVV
jgi:hypothetical protein